MRSFDYCRLAEKTWDTDILNLVARIHEYKGRQEVFTRESHVELKRLSETAGLQSTISSNRMEGIVTTDARMKQLFKGKTTPRNQDEEQLMGYRDVLVAIHENCGAAVTPSLILQLHRDLLERAGFSHAGHYKDVQNYINEVRSDGTAVTRFIPVSPRDTPDAVSNLCSAYTQAAAVEKVDPLILIPVFICDFLCIHPFQDGNGRMSRLLTLLLLNNSGFAVGKYISIERQIEETGDLYYEALELSDSCWHEGENNPLPFIRYMLQVILACCTEFEKRTGFASKSEKGKADDIVKAYVESKVGKFTGADVVEHCPGIGRSSALTALKKLTQEGIIVRKGSGKNTFYVRADCI